MPDVTVEILPSDDPVSVELEAQVIQVTVGTATLEELQAEIAARIAADLVLQSNINAEALARGLADTALQGQITTIVTGNASVVLADGAATTVDSVEAEGCLWHVHIVTAVGDINRFTVDAFYDGADAVFSVYGMGPDDGAVIDVDYLAGNLRLLMTAPGVGWSVRASRIFTTPA